MLILQYLYTSSSIHNKSLDTQHKSFVFRSVTMAQRGAAVAPSSLFISVPKRFDLSSFLTTNDPEKDKETREREELGLQLKISAEESSKFVDFEEKAKDYESRIVVMESKLQKIYKKIDKKRGKVDTEDIQRNISNLTHLAFQYSDDCERYRQDIDDLNAEVSAVKEKIVKLETKYMNCERQLQDEFMLEMQRKRQNKAQTDSGTVCTPTTKVSLEAEIHSLCQRLRDTNHVSNKNDVIIVNLEAQKRILEHRSYQLETLSKEVNNTEVRTSELLKNTQSELVKFKEHAQNVRNDRKAKDYLLKVAQHENNELKNERDVLKSQVVMLEQKVVGISMKLVSERASFVDITSQALFAERKAAEYDKLIQLHTNEIADIEEKCKILLKGGYEAASVFKKEAEEDTERSSTVDKKEVKKLEKKSFKDFRAQMKQSGMIIVEVELDNDSLFRAVSHQLFKSENRYVDLRKKCVDHIMNHRIRFSKLTSLDIDEYVRNLSLGAPGDDIEIKALEELIDRVILVYCRDSMNGDVPIPMNIKQRDISVMNSGGRFDAPLKLCSIADEYQYHSVSDKNNPLPLPMRKSTSILDFRTKVFQG